MKLVDRDWLLKENMYGNTNPIEYRTYADSLIKTAPIYSELSEAATNGLDEIEKTAKDINMAEILSHIEDGTLDVFLIGWQSEIKRKINFVRGEVK